MNRLAAEAAFRQNNNHRGDDIIDLHGLTIKVRMAEIKDIKIVYVLKRFIKEAVQHVNERISQLRSRVGPQNLTVIVGRGKHSQGGVGRLKPALLRHLSQQADLTSEEDRYGKGPEACMQLGYGSSIGISDN